MTTARREQLMVEAVPAPRGITVSARTHGITIDEAERYGGHDLGANPVEHMLAGLAAASLVVLRIIGEPEIAASAALTVSASLNVDRVMGADHGAAFEWVGLSWEVADAAQADRLRRALPLLAARRPGQTLIDGAADCTEEVSVRGR